MNTGTIRTDPFIPQERHGDLSSTVTLANHDAANNPMECLTIGSSFCNLLHLKLDELKKNLVNSSLIDNDKNTDLENMFNAFKDSVARMVDNAFWACLRFGANTRDVYADLLDFLMKGEITNNASKQDLACFFKNFETKWTQQFGPYIKFDLKTKIPNEFCFDSVKLERILDNLVLNAKKSISSQNLATSERILTIDVRVDEGSDLTQLVIEITNPGTLPKNARWKLFERGFTTSGQVEKGLGLFNVKTLTSALGGTVEVDENEGKVKFTITIPEFLKQKK